MAKRPLKFGPRKRFAEGGSDKYKAKFDRKVADIESDYEKAKARKTGRAAEVAKAKYEQRMADARDDMAKWTGADRSQTRAAEKAAERRLTMTRRFGAAPEPKFEDKPLATTRVSDADMAKLAESASTTARQGMADAGKFGDAFKAARAAGDKTFTWRGKSYTTDMAGEKKAAPRPTRAAPASTPKPAASTTARAAPASTPKPAASAPAAAGKKGLSGDEYSRAVSSGFIPPHASDEDRANIRAAIKAKQDAKYAQPYVPPKPKDKPFSEAALNATIRRSNANPWSNQNIARAKGGPVKKYAKGGKIDGCAVRGKTKAKRDR